MWAIWSAKIIDWASGAGAKVVGAAAVALSFIYIHKSAQRKAAKQAVKDERQRIETVSRVKKQEIRKQADEIDKDNAGTERADLRYRMRQQATDRDSR